MEGHDGLRGDPRFHCDDDEGVGDDHGDWGDDGHQVAAGEVDDGVCGRPRPRRNLDVMVLGDEGRGENFRSDSSHQTPSEQCGKTEN